MADGDPGEGLWCLLRHDDVYGALRDHETFSSAAAMGGGRAPSSPSASALVLINDDPPRHTRFRRLVNRAFTPRRVAELEPWIRSVADGLLDAADAANGKERDVVSTLTVPLPVTAIARLLGIPTEDHETFKRWSDALIAAVGTGAAPGEAQMRELGEMVAYFGQQVASRRAAPAEDLITALVTADVEGESLKEWEILGFCVLLLVAGNETTTNLIGNMLNILSQRPDLWAQLRSDRSLVETVVEETVRLDGPVQLLFRQTTRPVQVSGAELPAGAPVAVFFGAANRDPEAFPAPDEFRIDRDLHNHVAFGMGIHYCLGAPLARAEARIALNAMLDRYPTIAPGGTPGVRQSVTPVIYGFAKLPIVVSC